MQEPALAVSVKNVTKAFANHVALGGVSLDIRQGEFFSLLGPSGCGKSTLLRIIAGLEFATSGDVYIGSKCVNNIPACDRNANLVFQNYALFPHLTVEKNIAFGLEMRKTPKEEIPGRVKEGLALVRLEGLEKRLPRQLSGGQQQRVALARALVNNPTVVLLDEPLAALDYKLRRDMQTELKNLQKKLGLTFIFVTHDQEEAMSMSHRIAVMDKGHIVQVGTPQEIYRNPTDPFVARFIGESNLIKARIVESYTGSVTLDLFGSPLTLPTTQKYERNTNVTVLLRPENLELSISKPNGSFHARGVFQDSLFLGKETHYRIKLGEDYIVVSSGAAMPCSDGQELYLSWTSESVCLLEGHA